MQPSDNRLIFPVIDRHIWLNHAAISAWPTPVISAAEQFVQENHHLGASRYEQWLETEHSLREALARLIGASWTDISLLKNTSEGLNIIAQGLPWERGDEVIFPANEFPSNRLPWHALKTKGVVSKPISINLNEPEKDLIQALSPKTRLLTLSSVQYDTGLRFDLKQLIRICHDQGILVCIDAIQHVGAVPLDASDLGADFVVAGSHKWLMAPEGMAFLYATEPARQQCQVALPGWRMFEDPFNFERSDWQPPSGGRRFETGTMNMFGVHGLLASVQLLLQLGPKACGDALSERTCYVMDGLHRNSRLRLITPTPIQARAGILAYEVADVNLDLLVSRLAAEGIFVARRGPYLRISPHFYTPLEQLDQLIDRLNDPRWMGSVHD